MVFDDERALGHRTLRDRGECRTKCVVAEVQRNAFPEPDGRLLRAMACQRQALRQQVALEIAGNIRELAARSYQTGRLATLGGLRRRMIDLEDVHLFESGHPIGSTIESGAEDDDLPT